MRRLLTVFLLAFFALPIMAQDDEMEMMLPEAQAIEIDDLEINYYETEGEGQTIVFVHGNSSSGRSFLKQLSLLGEDYHVIAMDLPGHGLSSFAENGAEVYNLPGYAAVVTAFAEELEITDAVFVGASLGGHVLLEAADQLEDAKGIVIYGTPPLPFPLPEDAFLPSPTLAYLFAPELTSEDIEIWVSQVFAPDTEDLPESYMEDMAATDGQARLNLGASIMPDGYKDEVEIVANMELPLAIFHGGEELLINIDYIEKLDIPTLWREEVQIIGEAGHYAHWEQPDAFNELLIAFIEDVTAED